MQRDEEPSLARSRSDETDRRLLERFFAGENGALVSLYDRHHRRLYLYCARIVGSPERAEDIVQDMWERVARLRPAAPAIETPLALFFRIVRNLAINQIKSGGRFSSLDDLAEASHPVCTIPEPSHEEEIVRICLDRLRPEQRQILILNLYSGYQHDEIAAMLGRSPDAIRQRASRARRELRELVMAMAREEAAPHAAPHVSDGTQSLEKDDERSR